MKDTESVDPISSAFCVCFLFFFNSHETDAPHVNSSDSNVFGLCLYSVGYFSRPQACVQTK